ncbi:MAG: FkbM family methyltransferase [Verrucomicrobia bacterium]|nr:FkbM family methyltransferase [Verrucomicrobiota bacterium]
MRKSLSALLETASHPLPERDLPEIVIYGAGNCGRKLAKTTIAQGIRVLAFLDARAESLRTVDGIPCHLPVSEEACALAAKGIPAILGVFNYAADPTPIISLLKEIGFASIISYFEIHERLGMAPEFWLAPRLGLNERKEEILKGLELFGDPVSRQVYHDHLAFRLTFDQSLLASPLIETQYAPADLPPPRQPMRLVDGGAFIGDTVDFFLDQGVRIEAVAAFEPDMINFRKLVDASTRYTAEGIETLLYPCGIGGETGMLRFQSGQGAGSQLTESGDLHVQVMALDDVLPNFKPTLIKLDIEGAEIEALNGARRTIQQGMPDLAVCVYHTPTHLWEIPQLIRKLFPAYRLSLRAHRFNGFDTVLYASKR